MFPFAEKPGSSAYKGITKDLLEHLLSFQLCLLTADFRICSAVDIISRLSKFTIFSDKIKVLVIDQVLQSAKTLHSNKSVAPIEQW